MIDFDSLTLGEIAFIEDLSGQPISELAEDDAPKGKGLAAIATVVKRRSGEPAFTFNQALALTVAEVNTLLGMGEEETESEGKDDSSPESEQ
ncbi:MAG: hypothetical protein QM677_02470 [Microbacterium sp.]